MNKHDDDDNDNDNDEVVSTYKIIYVMSVLTKVCKRSYSLEKNTVVIKHMYTAKLNIISLKSTYKHVNCKVVHTL